MLVVTPITGNDKLIMNYCTSIFQKRVYDLTIADLLTFFSNEQEESNILEFKSGATALEDIYKEVSALLNSEGGVLIIGSPKETKRGEKKVCIGELTPCSYRSKDWLQQKLATSISPSPLGIKIQELSFKEGLVFVLEVPQSFNAPHQISERGQYYIRLEREAKPAPHGIVEALFFKRQRPDLECVIHAMEMKDGQLGLHIKLSNNSDYTAEGVSYLVHLEGVSKIAETENFRGKFDKKGQHSFFVCEISDQFLVSGIALESTVYFELISTYLLFTVSYWCKDTKAHVISALYDFESREFVGTVHSKKPEKTNSNIDELYEKLEKEIASVNTLKEQNTYYNPPPGSLM